MDKEERRRYAQLDRELSVLSQKMRLIEARYRKSIWMDKTYDKDRKDTLRNAELTLRLADDEEYSHLQEQCWDLEAQQRELGDIFDL